MYNYEYFNHLVKALYHVEHEPCSLTELLERYPVTAMGKEQARDFGFAHIEQKGKLLQGDLLV